MSGDPVALLVYGAAGVTALGVIWRAVIKPIRALFFTIRDLVEQWKQVLESTRDLTSLVAKNIVNTDARLSRLEEALLMQAAVTSEEARQTQTLLAQQLQQRWEAERLVDGWDGTTDRRRRDGP